jgi:hypothetical protein
MPADDLNEPVPPYVPFGTLVNQLQRMEREGVPARIDPSYLTGMGGTMRNQFRVSLRALGLIDESGNTTEALVRLAMNPDQRPMLLAEILQSRFPRLVSLNGNATRGQLEEIMVDYGLKSADTRRKAMSFYLAAATYAGIPLSSHLRPAKGGVSPSATPRRSRTAKKRPTASRATEAESRPADPSDMRRIYFDLLVEKAKQADDPALLDRIERLVGIAPSEESATTTAGGDAG